MYSRILKKDKEIVGENNNLESTMLSSLTAASRTFDLKIATRQILFKHLTVNKPLFNFAELATNQGVTGFVNAVREKS